MGEKINKGSVKIQEKNGFWNVSFVQPASACLPPACPQQASQCLTRPPREPVHTDGVSAFGWAPWAAGFGLPDCLIALCWQGDSHSILFLEEKQDLLLKWHVFPVGEAPLRRPVLLDPLSRRGTRRWGQCEARARGAPGHVVPARSLPRALPQASCNGAALHPPPFRASLRSFYVFRFPKGRWDGLCPAGGPREPWKLARGVSAALHCPSVGIRFPGHSPGIAPPTAPPSPDFLVTLQG